MIVCIGNSLAGDDAAGGAVFEALTKEGLGHREKVFLLGTGGIQLLDLLEADDLLVIVDAVQLGQPPGTIHVLDWDRLPRPGGAAVTPHGLGVREVIELGRILYNERMPREVVLVGVEGRNFSELGAPLSGEVAAAIPEAVAEVKRQVGRYRISCKEQ